MNHFPVARFLCLLRSLIPSVAILACLSGAAISQGKVWVVAPKLTTGVDFTDVNPAVRAASNGDTILVRPGTYQSLAVLDKALAMSRRLTKESDMRPPQYGPPL